MRVHPAGAVLAVCAAAWHVFLMTSANNDNFVHMTLAKQWLAGDWPVRDFFEQGWVLQYGLSAVAQTVGGDRLLSEAIVVGLAWSVSTYVVFEVVLRLTGHLGAAVLAAPLLIVAGARGYSYPKGIVYAVAALLWWKYVQRPSMATLLGYGAWAAVAFYWRPDHGIYVAVGLALAVVAAHGMQFVSITRCSLAAATMLVVLAPFFLYVQSTVGLIEYAQTGLAAAQVEHVTQGPHQWPVLRLWGRLWTTEPAEQYAPVVGIRWTSASSPEQRRQVMERYGLTSLGSEESVERVRLSALALANTRGVINEPIVEDTAGIERGSATLSTGTWTTGQQWRFKHAWLRVQFLPSLDRQGRASEIAAALFYALPILLIAAAPWITRNLSPWVTTRQLIAFALFALLVDLAMLRSPFPARGPDAVVPSAVAYGCCVAWMWRSALSGVFRDEATGLAWLEWSRKQAPRALFALSAAVLILATTSSVAIAGRFTDRLTELAGDWTSLSRARAAWSAAYDELVASPPLAYFVDQRARFSLLLAAYVRDCVPSTERVLVLWFEPEIYYYGDRLMAQRHLVFAPTWASLEPEQRMTMEKIRRFLPPLVLARRSALDGYARASFPGVVDYVEREYRLAATVADDGEEYLIFAQKSRPVVRAFGSGGWPCYTQERSLWSRVGDPKSH